MNVYFSEAEWPRTPGDVPSAERKMARIIQNSARSQAPTGSAIRQDTGQENGSSAVAAVCRYLPRRWCVDGRRRNAARTEGAISVDVPGERV